MKLEATPEDIARTLHPHPGLSEAIWEKALDIKGETLHYLSLRISKGVNTIPL